MMLTLASFLPDQKTGGRIRVAFYNVENLFDTIDSSLDDDEFLPGGARRWNSSKYFRKINNIFKVIVLCGEWSPPDIIGLCEVENFEVLQDLINRTPLKQLPYTPLFAISADSRGIGVGLLFNHERFDLLGKELWYPVNNTEDTIKTRSVLSVTLGDMYDTLDVIISHWPSMRGGVMATDDLRREVAAMIRENVEKKLKNRSRSKVLIMGDFNCVPGSETMTEWLGTLPISSHIQPEELYNLSSGIECKTGGTYKFQGNWDMLDQIIVSGTLLESAYGYRVAERNCIVVSDDVLLTEDTRYRGQKPFSTFSGYDYTGGYSDHLPVILDLILN